MTSREVDAVWRASKWGFCSLYAGMHISAVMYFSTNIATGAELDCQVSNIFLRQSRTLFVEVAQRYILSFTSKR